MHTRLQTHMNNREREQREGSKQPDHAKRITYVRLFAGRCLDAYFVTGKTWSNCACCLQTNKSRNMKSIEREQTTQWEQPNRARSRTSLCFLAKAMSAVETPMRYPTHFRSLHSHAIAIDDFVRALLGARRTIRSTDLAERGLLRL